jgi:hypothetical protein
VLPRTVVIAFSFLCGRELYQNYRHKKAQKAQNDMMNGLYA